MRHRPSQPPPCRPLGPDLQLRLPGLMSGQLLLVLELHHGLILVEKLLGVLRGLHLQQPPCDMAKQPGLRLWTNSVVGFKSSLPFFSWVTSSQWLRLSGPVSFFFFCLFAISRAAPVACAVSQARGLMGAVAVGVHHSHSIVGSKLHLWPSPQITATPDP